MNNDLNIGLAVCFVLVVATLITWITKLRRENNMKDAKLLDNEEEIKIKDKAIEYQRHIIDQLAKKGANGKHG